MRTISLLLFAALLPIAFAGTSGPTPIPAPPAFQLSTAGQSLCAGQVNYMPITVTNPYALGGASMTDTVVGIVSNNYMYPAGNGTVTPVTIPNNDSATVNVPIFVSANAPVIIVGGLSISYTYQSLYGDVEQKNLSFSVENCGSQLSVSVTPETFTAGVIQNVTLGLSNSGATNLSHISVRLSIPSQDGSWLTTQPVQVGMLPANSETSINERVFITKNATQSVPLNISATFYNGSNINQLYETRSMPARGIIQISSSSFTVSPSMPAVGSIFSVSFVLTNIGTAGASAVTVSTIAGNGFRAFGSESTFIGDVAADSQVPVTMSLQTNSSVKSGTYTVPIRVNYLDDLRNNVTVWANATVTLVPQSLNATGTRTVRGSSGFSTGTAIIVMLVAAGGAWLYMRSRKNKAKKK